MRFRLSLRFSLNDEIVEANSVRETFATEDPRWFPSDGARNQHLRGEAAPAPLGGNRWIFGMLDAYTTVGGGGRLRLGEDWTPQKVLRERQLAGFRTGGAEAPLLLLREVEARLTTGLELTPEELPVLVVFRNGATPGSGTVVDALDLTDMFPDVRLASGTVTLTEEPIDFGASAKALPWLAEPGPAARADDRSLPVRTGDFSRLDPWRHQ